MSRNCCRNHYDPGLQQLNDQYNWIFDWDQSEVGGFGSHQRTNISYGNTIDPDFGHFSEQIQTTKERKLPEVDSLGRHHVSTSSENRNPAFRKPNEKFFWEDDSKQSSIDIFGWAKKKITELSNWLSNKVGGSRGHHVHCHCHCKHHARNEKTLQGKTLHGIRDENKFSKPTKTCSVNNVKKNNGLRQSTSIPVEPESKEEDLYTRCRKEARKKQEAAADHKKASKIASLKGDHKLAGKLDQKAEKEEAAAKKLHERASRKIFKENNKDNGIMKVDLHHLHVREAIEAVQKHLNKVEKLSKKEIGKLQQKKLEVVTGKGIHSRGAPKLPGAVRSFLNENGYEFDGRKPGVVMVQPKFRRI